jgi:hypothetical protein
MMPVVLGVRDLGILSDAVEPAELVDDQVDAPLVVGGDRRRRQPAMVAALISCVVLIVAGVALFGRRVTDTDEAPAAATPPLRDVLLLPRDPVTANELDQSSPGSWSSAVQSPAGRVIGINASLDYWGELPPDADVRTVGVLTVGTMLGDTSHTYVALQRCAMLSVTTPATIPTWDTDVTDLLAGLTSDSGVVTVELPPGWRELATGPQAEYFNTAFSHTVGNSPHEMRLFQSRNTGVAQFLSQTYRGTAVPISFGQSSAWVVHSNDSQQWNYLIWQSGTTAAMLGGQAISDADLVATARSLVATAPDEWIRRVNARQPTADPATVTATTVFAATIADQAGCGTRSIRFR